MQNTFSILLHTLLPYFVSGYHSEDVIAPLWTMKDKIGSLKIKGYQFSESGDGKGKCDRVRKTFLNFYTCIWENSLLF